MLKKIHFYLIKKYWDWTTMEYQQFPGHRVLKDIHWILQKVFKGYNDPDLWNLDHCFVKMILPRLKSFKRMKRNGYPATATGTYPEISCPEDWERILDAMIKGFESFLIECDSDCVFTTEKYMQLQKEIDHGLKLFGKFFQYLWD